MSHAQATFQRRFVDALMATPHAPAAAPVPSWALQPGFAVYRNTVHKGCIDALEANFPAVVRLVGVTWFREAAARHLPAHPPRDACLLRYGDGFADTLAALAPDDLPYLHGVATLDRLWTTAHTAADAPVLPGDALAGRDPQALATARLHPHPAARWHWFDTLPIYSIWSANRSADPAALDALSGLSWTGEGALLLRPHDEVQWQSLSAAGCTFLDACARGEPLGEAAAAVLTHHPDADLATLLAQLLHAGVFTSLETIHPCTPLTT